LGPKPKNQAEEGGTPTFVFLGGEVLEKGILPAATLTGEICLEAQADVNLLFLNPGRGSNFGFFLGWDPSMGGPHRAIIGAGASSIK